MSDDLKTLRGFVVATVDDVISDTYIDDDVVIYHATRIWERANILQNEVGAEVCRQALAAKSRVRMGQDPRAVMREFREALDHVFGNIEPNTEVPRVRF